MFVPMRNQRRKALPDAARLGTVELGCFRLKELLGRGSYGTAFLADQEGFGREAVVKIAHAGLIEGRDAERVRARFASELQTATRVNHPNVVTLFTAGETADGLPAIAMEYVPGAPLEDILEQRAGHLAPSFVHEVFAQLGSAVAAFHKASVTHRDLSPSNIIVGDGDDGSLVVKVLDFGAARLGPDSGRVSIVGTPRYMAPEQVLGTAGPASDVYALAAMLWWAIAGLEVQSEVTTLQDVMEARLMGPQRKDIRDVAPGTAPEVAKLLSDMLEFEPSSRPTAAEFCERWAACDVAEPDAPKARRSVTIPPSPRAESARTQRIEMLEAACFDDDPVRIGQLRGFLEHSKCRMRVVSLYEPMETLARPGIIFVSGSLPGGAAESILHRASTLFAGVTVVAMVKSERERSAMIRAGADLAVRVPVDLPHIAEALEEARAPQEIDAADTTPYGLVPSRRERSFSVVDIEAFLGLAPELIADIIEAIEQRHVGTVLDACAQLRERASTLGGVELARLSTACAAFAETRDFSSAAGFGVELEKEYGTLFQRLMTAYTDQTRQEIRR